MKKTIYLFLFALIAIGIGFFFLTDMRRIGSTNMQQGTQTDQTDSEKIGGERDEHGCLGPAGYSYSEEIGACIRDWELDETQKTAAAKAVETILGMDTGLTIIDVKRAATDDMYMVTIQKPNTEQVLVRVEDAQMGETADETSDISDEILAALVEKNDWDEDLDIKVTVSSNDGEFASGGAGPAEGGPGGGGWFAANIEGEWKIIWDGNGSIICSDLEDFETQYDVEIPTDLIEVCYDDDAGIEVTR